jgi:hypothetical protein
MWRAAATPAIVCLAFSVGACGQSQQARLQGQEIAYQSAVGSIDKVFAHPVAGDRRAQALLRRAVAEYRALRPPEQLRALNATVVAGLSGEYRAFVATPDTIAGVHAAEAKDARARAIVADALRRIAAIIGACRADVARCG